MNALISAFIALIREMKDFGVLKAVFFASLLDFTKSDEQKNYQRLV